MGTENAPVLDRPAPLRRLHDSGAGYKYPDLLTYLTAFMSISFDGLQAHLLYCRCLQAANDVCVFYRRRSSEPGAAVSHLCMFFRRLGFCSSLNLPGCHGDSVTWLSCRHWCVLHLVTEADAWTLAFLTVHHDGTVASVIVAQRAPLYLCSITLQLCTICGTSLKQVLILCGARGYAVLVTSFHWSMIVMSFRNLIAITIVTSALPSEQKNDFVLSNL